MGARPTVAEAGTVGLLAELLRDTPRLHGALCATKRGHFIEAETGNRVRVEQCISICRRCPALEACRVWAATQPGLVGVVAGKLHATVRADDGDDESPSEAG
ncbi:WhiB family transcriptional regulator [Mycobacterium sp. pV006]|uniref:WhiB family transcriptional regulator n=1 Tax=Mycobacterium sp. pV006 TaxID=3238983 RepID=UPI00351BB3D9